MEDLGSPQMGASHWFHPSLLKIGSEEDVPRYVYSMYPAKAVISGERKGLRCLHADEEKTPIIWKDFRTSDPTTWYSGTRSVLDNFQWRREQDAGEEVVGRRRL